MTRHPGGREQTLRLLRRARLRAGAAVLDLGAGDGDSVSLLRAQGFRALGIDLAATGALAARGDLLHTEFADASFDAVLSECTFFLTGDVPGALREAHRLLKPGGKLLLSDVFFEPPEPLLAEAGFCIKWREDITPAWKEYYLRAIWEGTAKTCRIPIPKGTCRYWMLIAGKEA